MLPIVLAITGASGAVYAARLLQALVHYGRVAHCVVSGSARVVARQELGLELPDGGSLEPLLRLPAPPLPPVDTPPGRVVSHAAHDFLAPIASGSHLTAGMVVCPCSGDTLAAVALGGSANLIQRAAAVHLKERRKLILVPRETPLARNYLQNLLAAHDSGAVILPAMPGWYHGVQSPWDLVDFVTARVLDQLGVEHRLTRRWGS